MQWTDEPNAGFTTGTPWLKVNPNYTTINAAAQQDDPDSVRNFYKQLIALRKHPDYQETIVYGSLEPINEEQLNLMAYLRKGNRTLLVIGNYQRESQTMELPSDCKKVLLNNDSILNLNNRILTLQGYQAVILEL